MVAHEPVARQQHRSKSSPGAVELPQKKNPEARMLGACYRLLPQLVGSYIRRTTGVSGDGACLPDWAYGNQNFGRKQLRIASHPE